MLSRRVLTSFSYHKALKALEQDPMFDFPGIDEGIKGMAFIENVVRSSRDNTNKWTKFEI